MNIGFTTLARASRGSILVRRGLRFIHNTNRNGIKNDPSTFWSVVRYRWLTAIVGTSVGFISWVGYNYAGQHHVAFNMPTIYAKSKDDDDDDGKMPRSKQYNFIAQAVEMTAPTVVHVETAATNRTFFGDVVTHGSGSGFIVSQDGLVLTNAHVIERAHAVKVKLFDGSELPGEVIDIDVEADLALIKLNTKVRTACTPANWTLSLEYIALNSSKHLENGWPLPAMFY